MGVNQSINDKKIILKSKSLKNIDTDIKRYEILKSIKCPKTLNLSNNKIAVLNPTICDEISRMKNVHDYLQEVNLSHNRIQIIPETFLQLVNISKLKLDHNEIENIPDRLGDCLYNLKELHLNNNKISEIPWNFNKLRQLRVFSINNNNISYFPNTLGELQLEEISYHNNKLRENFPSSTIEVFLSSVMQQKIPKEYRDQVQKLIAAWEIEGKGKTETNHQFLFFLQQEEFKKPLRVYMEKEVSHENLDFWQRVDNFKRRYNSVLEIRSPELLREAVEIFNEFLAEGAPHSVNIDDGETLRKLFTSSTFPIGINQWIFDSSYESIFNLMYSDTFSRYKLTEEGGRNFSTAVKMWEALPINRIRKLSVK